jgi:hypothetical protein
LGAIGKWLVISARAGIWRQFVGGWHDFGGAGASWAPDGKQIAYTPIAANKARLMVSGQQVERRTMYFRFPRPGFSPASSFTRAPAKF